MKNSVLYAIVALFLAGCSGTSALSSEQLVEPAAQVSLEADGSSPSRMEFAPSFVKEDQASMNSLTNSAALEKNERQPGVSLPIQDVLIPSTGSQSDEASVLVAVPHQQSSCYTGCSENSFYIIDTLAEGSSHKPIGIDPNGAWLYLLTSQQGRACWLPTSAISLHLGSETVKPADLSANSLITVDCPAEPASGPQITATDLSQSSAAASPTPLPETPDPPETSGNEKDSTIEWGNQLPNQPGRFARLMHDPQWMDWPSRIASPEWRRGFYYDWYPETVPLWLKPKGGDGRLPYTRDWLEYLRALQPNDEAAVWIARVAAGLFNKGNDFIPILNLDELGDPPIGESISSGGNVVKVLEIRGSGVRIEMLYNDYLPPDPAKVNYFTTPWLVTKFTAVSIDGELGNPGNIDVYFPNLARQQTGYWVEKQRVELFPQLPFQGIANRHLIIRQVPSSAARPIGELIPDKGFTINEYLPQASNVWGRINVGWILL